MSKWFGLDAVLVLAAPVRPAPELGRPTVPLEIHRTTDPDDALLRRGMTGARRRYARVCLARGDVAFVAVVGEDVVGWVWLARRSHRDPSTGLWIGLGPADAYTYDGWVVEGHRRHGVFHALYSAVFDDLHDSGGATRVLAYVLRSNTAVRRAVAPYGFVQIQMASFVDVFVRFGFRLPLSARPRRGPLTRAIRLPWIARSPVV